MVNYKPLRRSDRISLNPASQSLHSL